MTCHHLHHFVFVDVVLTVPSELLSAAAHNCSCRITSQIESVLFDTNRNMISSIVILMIF